MLEQISRLSHVTRSRDTRSSTLPSEPDLNVQPVTRRRDISALESPRSRDLSRWRRAVFVLGGGGTLLLLLGLGDNWWLFVLIESDLAAFSTPPARRICAAVCS